MIDLLVRTFIKSYEDIKNPKVRVQFGMLSGVVGIICNLILFTAKLFAGIITASVSILADAFNNLSDAGSSIVTLIGFKISGKPADTEHPFGHGRIEYLSGLIVAMAIILMGMELLKTAVSKILHPEAMEFSIISIVILIASIAIKMWMATFNRKLGNKINSTAMIATATDSLSDCIATATVLIAIIISEITGFNIDGYAGAVVALFVLFAGVQTAKDTIQPLLGQPADPEFVDRLRQIILSHKEIIGIHDMIIHDYGPGRIFATLHAEIPCEMNILEAHDIIDITERQVQEELQCGVSIHMDPIVDNDETVSTLKMKVKDILYDIDEKITMHDFRITEGPYIKNLIFDIVVPFEYHYSDEQLQQMIGTKIQEINDTYYAVIQVDKCYTEKK